MAAQMPKHVPAKNAKILRLHPAGEFLPWRTETTGVSMFPKKLSGLVRVAGDVGPNKPDPATAPDDNRDQRRCSA